MRNGPGAAPRPTPRWAGPGDQLRSWTGIVRAELSKMVVWKAAWFVGVLAAAASIASAIWYWKDGLVPFPGEPAFTRADVVATMASTVRSSGVVVFVAILLGTLVGSAEWRQRTWAWAFERRPGRTSVIVAKFVAAGIGGGLLAVGGLFLGALVGSFHLERSGAALSAHHVPGGANLGLLWADTLRAVPTEAFACGSMAMLWCGIGLLVRSEALAVLLAVVYPIGVERFLASDVPAVARFLPEWAIQSVAAMPNGFSFTTAAGDAAAGATPVTPLAGIGGAAAVLVALAVVGAAAWLALRRRAIT